MYVKKILNLQIIILFGLFYVRGGSILIVVEYLNMSYSFILIMKIYFYCTDCVNDLGLINVGSDDYCKSCSEKISNPDDCLFCEGCYK